MLAHAASVAPISPWQLVGAMGLVLAAAAVSMVMKLGLEKRLALSAARTIVQLLLLGYVLSEVFALDAPWAVGAVIAVMIATASHAAVARTSYRYKGVHLTSVITMCLSSLVVATTVTQAIIQVDPWYKAQYVIPMLGMILGNTLTGISLCLDSLLEGLRERRGEVEMMLSLGANRWEAARPFLRASVRKGMIPIINSMMVVGLVSLPGMMTGQIINGGNPPMAARYQIIVMFMIAAACALGCMIIANLSVRKLFNTRDQLLHDAIQKRG